MHNTIQYLTGIFVGETFGVSSILIMNSILHDSEKLEIQQIAGQLCDNRDAHNKKLFLKTLSIALQP